MSAAYYITFFNHYHYFNLGLRLYTISFLLLRSYRCVANGPSHITRLLEVLFLIPGVLCIII